MYREGKPLADLIAPDHRVRNLAITVSLSMLAGIALWLAGEAFFAHRQTSESQPHLPVPTGHIVPAVLSGAEHDITMPPSELSILHVWMQGCADCMSAFQAMRRLQADGGLNVKVPIYNIAYGEAEPTWAKQYGVGENLAYDLGGASVVRPLGINTFTTIVIDREGTILLRDRPDRPGYRERVRAAVHADDGAEADNDGAKQTLSAETVNRVVAAQRMQIKRACWDPARSTVPRANIDVRAVVGADGRVSSTTSSGAARSAAGDAADVAATNAIAPVASCVEGEVRKWRFPAAPERADVTINIPFKFVRQ